MNIAKWKKNSWNLAGNCWNNNNNKKSAINFQVWTSINFAKAKYAWVLNKCVDVCVCECCVCCKWVCVVSVSVCVVAVCVCSITLVGVVHHKKPSASRRQQLNLELQREVQAVETKGQRQRGRETQGEQEREKEGIRGREHYAGHGSWRCQLVRLRLQTAAWQLVERSGGGGGCQPQQLRSCSTATSLPSTSLYTSSSSLFSIPRLCLSLLLLPSLL